MKKLRDLKIVFEGAQQEADRHREQYHNEVRRLHSEGMALRDIADALGVSHQRIHQIVGTQNVLVCTFCSQLQSEVSKLIAGPGVYICDACINDAHRVAEGDVKRAGRVRSISEELSKTISCSFCNKKAQKVRSIAAGRGVQICNECIDLCREIIQEES